IDAEYEIANWYTGTHPQSPYLNNVIAARPGPERTRLTLFNYRLTIRDAEGNPERRLLSSEDDYRQVLADLFGIEISRQDLRLALRSVEEKGSRDSEHPFFA